MLPYLHKQIRPLVTESHPKLSPKLANQQYAPSPKIPYIYPKSASTKQKAPR